MPDVNGPSLLCPGCGSPKVTAGEPFCSNCAGLLDALDPLGKEERDG